MSDGVKTVKRRQHSRGHDRSAESERHRSRHQPPAERGLHLLSRRQDAAGRHHHRRRRPFLLARLGSRRRPRAANESDEDWGVSGFGGLNYPRNLNKPIIAAVNGIACGGGFEIVLGTDIIVMEEHAKFALPEINVGVLADAGTIKLRRRIPYHVAVEFLMTGRWMDAAEAKHWGLANHVVPKGQALPRPARSRGSSPTARRCSFPPSSSCCATRKWSRSTRPSSCTTRSTSCSRSSAPTTSRKGRGRSPRSASRAGPAS